MKDAFDHYAAVGYPVPAFVNPADYYLDMVSPGYKLDKRAPCHRVACACVPALRRCTHPHPALLTGLGASRAEHARLLPSAADEEFAAYWKEHGLPKQAARADQAIASKGKTAWQLLEEKDGMLTKVLGPSHTAKHSTFERSTYKVSFPTQIRLIFKRELMLLVRDPTRLATEIGMNIAVGVVLYATEARTLDWSMPTLSAGLMSAHPALDRGIAFQGVGTKPPQNQIGAFAMILQLSFITTMVGIPLMDEPKLVVKLEAGARRTLTSRVSHEPLTHEPLPITGVPFLHHFLYPPLALAVHSRFSLFGGDLPVHRFLHQDMRLGHRHNSLHRHRLRDGRAAVVGLWHLLLLRLSVQD
eukprot:7179366-Prymnesium_polylepis.1